MTLNVNSLLCRQCYAYGDQTPDARITRFRYKVALYLTDLHIKSKVKLASRLGYICRQMSQMILSRPTDNVCNGRNFTQFCYFSLFLISLFTMFSQLRRKSRHHKSYSIILFSGNQIENISKPLMLLRMFLSAAVDLSSPESFGGNNSIGRDVTEIMIEQITNPSHQAPTHRGSRLSMPGSAYSRQSS